MREVLCLRSPGETRIAIAEDGQLTDLHIARDHHLRRGTILSGRVTGKAPGGQAVFVDIGQDKAGFLPIKGKAPTDGQSLRVQVKREAQGEKGAELTDQPTLQGRFLVFTPSRPGIAVSKAIPVKAERQRLQEIIEGLATAEEGWVVRTLAEGASAEDLGKELERLRQRWANMGDGYTPHPLMGLLTSTDTAIGFNNADQMAQAKALCSVLAPRMTMEPLSITACDVGEALESLLEPVVPLPGGGRLIIETTSALTAIDIDSGGGTARDANAQAVPEIARQLRLRNIGGQVIVDFIPEGKKKGVKDAAECLRQAIRKDPVPTHVMGITPMGLVEITRERLSPPLSDVLLANSTPRLNLETAALTALRSAQTEAQATKAATVTLRAHSALLALLDGTLKDALAETRLGMNLKLVADDSLPRNGYQVEPG